MSQNGDRIILLRIALVISSFYKSAWEIPWFSCFSVLVDTSRSPTSPYFWIWIDQTTSSRSRNIHICLINEPSLFQFLRKTRAGNHRDWPYKSLKILSMGSLSLKRTWSRNFEIFQMKLELPRRCIFCILCLPSLKIQQLLKFSFRIQLHRNTC